MKKFLIILFTLVLAVSLVRMVVNPEGSRVVPVLEVLQKLKTMDLPLLDMFAVFEDEYNDILDILDMSIGDWGGADNPLDYLRAIALGLWSALKSIFYVATAPYVLLFYIVGTIVKVLRVLGMLFFL